MGENTRFVAGVPRVPDGMLTRSRLLAQVGRSPLTVVRAPAGSGKTVLLAQWSSAQRRHGAWVTVEPDIGSRRSFWAAVADTVAGAGVEVHLPQDGGDAVRTAVLRAFRTCSEPFLLVIDDAHELHDDTVADDLLALLRASPHVTAVVGTRSRGELEAPRHALTLDIAVVGPDEMVLSTDDVESIVGDKGSAFGTTAELLEASGGNPLMLRAIVAGSSAGIRAGASAQAVVGDHVRGLFETHGAALAAFASSTAVPDDVDVELAGHLSALAPDHAASMLAVLETEGLVMRRPTGDSVRYRYHPLVRDVLRQQLRKQHPDEFRRASLVASADAESRKLFLPALRHAVDAEDYTRASDVCLHGGFTLLRSRGAAAILQRVPLRYVARLPFLAVVLGLAANARGERLKALELLTLALGASRALRNRQRVAERIGLALIETVVLRITGRAAEAVPAARRVLRMLEEAPSAELEEIVDQVGSYRYQAALSLFRAGRLAEARLAAEWVRVSRDALHRLGPDALGATALVAAVDAGRGECRTAAGALARIDDEGFSADLLDAYVGSLAHLARGILALEAGDAAGAREHADLFLGRENLEHGMLFMVLRVFVELWQGAPEVGLRMLDEKVGADRPRARLSPEDRQVIVAARVLSHAALGQTGPAHDALRGLDRSDPVAAVLQATLLLQEQRPDLVIEQLSSKTFNVGPRVRAAAEILMVCASLQRGDDDLAASALRRFVATISVHEIVSPVVLVPAEQREALWQFAERNGVDAATIDRLRPVPAPFRMATERVTLTPREAAVLAQLRETSSLAQIASTLGVSSNTVKSQVRSLYLKLGVTAREDALRAAYLQGFLTDSGV